MRENLRSKTRSKHIDPRLKDVTRGVSRLVFCPTEDMCDAGMTKGLAAYRFAQHCNVMLGRAHHTATSSTVRGEL